LRDKGVQSVNQMEMKCTNKNGQSLMSDMLAIEAKEYSENNFN